MPGWSDITNAIRSVGSGHDVVRRAQIANLAAKTGRNVIVYYSGFLQKGPLLPQTAGLTMINDADKNGFMATCQNLDFKKGLDLVLHTQGGDAHATESIIDYLQSLFGNNIRAIVPQIAMSGGTVISCACKSIVMGKHSNIGPIDPQIGGVAAHGILEEFEQAKSDIENNPAMAHLWAPIIAKYTPTLIGACEKSIRLIEGMALKYLARNMFENDLDPASKAQAVVNEIGSHAKTLAHGRHISLIQAQDLGLNIEPLEDDPELQDLVLSVHHACMVTLQETFAIKIIENHESKTFILAVQPHLQFPIQTPQMLPQQPQAPQHTLPEEPLRQTKPTRATKRKATAAESVREKMSSKSAIQTTTKKKKK